MHYLNSVQSVCWLFKSAPASLFAVALKEIGDQQQHLKQLVLEHGAGECGGIYFFPLLQLSKTAYMMCSVSVQYGGVMTLT